MIGRCHAPTKLILSRRCLSTLNIIQSSYTTITNMAPKTAEKKPVVAKTAKKPVAKKAGGKKGSKKGVESWKV